ncbi:MAG: hypothetical protein HUJ88_12900 [Fusobacterium necrophorum]|nr:hypothetical protein [Fusobacterium necrophorum]
MITFLSFLVIILINLILSFVLPDKLKEYPLYYYSIFILFHLWLQKFLEKITNKKSAQIAFFLVKYPLKTKEMRQKQIEVVELQKKCLDKKPFFTIFYNFAIMYFFERELKKILEQDKILYKERFL